MIKKITSAFIAITMLFSLAILPQTSASAINVTATYYSPDEDVDYIKLYFYMPKLWSSEYSDTAGVIWARGTGALSTWQTMYKMYETETENIFYFYLPTDVDCFVITNLLDILTHSASALRPYAFQSTEIYVTKDYDGYCYKKEDKNIVYHYGLKTEDLDGKIFVFNPDKSLDSIMYGHETYDGEFFEYYGNGEYGISTEYGKSPIHNEEFCYTKTIKEDMAYINSQTSTPPPCKDEFKVKKYTPSKNIETVRLYYFNYFQDDNCYVSWDSGTDARVDNTVYEGTQTENTNISYIDVPKDVSKIYFSNCLPTGNIMTSEGEWMSVLPVNNGSGMVYNAFEDPLYPEGLKTDDLNNMIFLRDPSYAFYEDNPYYFGQYYHYYGNGEYGFSKTKTIDTYVYNTSTFSEKFAMRNKFTGDVNNDGCIDVSDITIIQMYMASYTDTEAMPFISNVEYKKLYERSKKTFGNTNLYREYILLGDFDRNKEITISDVTAIQLHIVGEKV